MITITVFAKLAVEALAFVLANSDQWLPWAGLAVSILGLHISAIGIAATRYYRCRHGS